MADFTVAIDSFAASIGPLGSAREMARPATNGARTIRSTPPQRSHSWSSGRSFVGGWRWRPRPSARPRGSLPRRAGHCHGPLVRQDRRPCRRSKISAGLPSRTRGRAHSRSLITDSLVTPSPNVGPLPTSRPADHRLVLLQLLGEHHDDAAGATDIGELVDVTVGADAA